MTEEATKKRFIILNLHEKSLESSFLTSNRASESKSKLKIEQNAYSQIRELLSRRKELIIEMIYSVIRKSSIAKEIVLVEKYCETLLMGNYEILP